MSLSRMSLEVFSLLCIPSIVYVYLDKYREAAFGACDRGLIYSFQFLYIKRRRHRDGARWSVFIVSTLVIHLPVRVVLAWWM
ncbi:hypothetical protein J3E69DRAFT_322486 [Trichoderma sp. SZMC 28015]